MFGFDLSFSFIEYSFYKLGSYAIARVAGFFIYFIPNVMECLIVQFRHSAKNTFGKIYDLLYKKDADLSDRLGVPPFERAWEMLALAAQSRRGQDSISIATLRERLSWPDLLPDDEGVLGSSIEITTVHQSKGLEYDRVSIVREERDETRDAGERDDGGLLEEANVLFVALSRAVELEITQFGKKCHSHCAIFEQVGDCVMPREGVFAKVIEPGQIAVGDVIEICDD